MLILIANKRFEMRFIDIASVYYMTHLIIIFYIKILKRFQLPKGYNPSSRELYLINGLK